MKDLEKTTNSSNSSTLLVGSGEVHSQYFRVRPNLSRGASLARRWLAGVRREGRLVLLSVAGALIIGAAWVLSSGDRYISFASLEVLPGPNLEVGFGAELATTHSSLVRSDRVADRVLADPTTSALVAAEIGSKGGHSAYLKLISTETIPGSSLIRVGVTTANADRSAQIAKAHLRSYFASLEELRDDLAERKRREVERTSDKISRTVKDERRDLLARSDEAARSKIEIIDERIAILNRQLVDARERRMSTQAALEDAISAPGDLFSDELSQISSERAAELSVQEELRAEFGPMHPRMRAIDSAVAKLEGQLSAARESAEQELRAQYESTRVAEENLNLELERELEKKRKLSMDSLDSNLEHRKLEALESALDSVHSALPMALISGAVAEVRLLEGPTVPEAPIGLGRTLRVAIFGLLGAISAMIIVLIRELSRKTLKTPEEVAHRLGVTTLAVIPEFPKRKSLRDRERIISRPALPAVTESTVVLELTEDLVIQPSPPIVRGLSSRIEKISAGGVGPSTREAYRLASSTLLMRSDKASNIVAVTSAQKGDGKTTTLCNIAAALAECGKQVVIVDADLRSPAVHHVLGIGAKEAGLVHYLAGDLEVHQIIRETTVNNLSVVPAGGIAENPAEYLSDIKFSELLEILAKTFDFVLIDTPPVMPVTDALFVARCADQVTFVVDARRTPYELAQQGIALLAKIGVSSTEVVLNQLEREAEYFKPLAEFSRY